MIEWGALVLALVKLIASIMDARQATAPQRAREQQDDRYDQDIIRNAQAAAAGDAATLSLDFEAERQAAIRRGDLEPSPAGELQQHP